MKWPYVDLEFPWGNLAYRDSGESEAELAVVFLHGTGCDSTDYESVIGAWPGTEKKPRFIGVDFRCHGKSAAPHEAFSVRDFVIDVTVLLDHLDLPNIILAGHSLGGMVAMPVAHHASVKGLVLFEGWTKLNRTGAFDSKSHMFGHLADKEVQRIKDRGVAYRSRVTPVQWDEFWGSVETFDGTEHLQSLAIPILEVYGTVGRQENAERLLNVPCRENIAWHWIENVGHFLPQECPEELAFICAEFIRNNHVN